MKQFSLTLLIFFLFFFKLSNCLECSSQVVTFGPHNTSFTIISDPNDLTSKNCSYTFIVPKYYVPQIIVVGLSLTGNNRITARQYTEYGGWKVYSFTNNNYGVTLAPLNFTLEINLPQKTATDSFKIAITVKDTTPVGSSSFMVDKDLGKLIDSNDINGNSSVVQVFPTNSPVSNFNIKIAMFTDMEIVKSSLQKIHIYDSGVYKGNLVDVFNAENVQQTCSGSQFTIVNTNSISVGIFTVLVSPKRDWAESQVSISSVNPVANNVQTFTATNGAFILQEITTPLIPNPQNFYRQITFRGDGELNIFAGCVTGVQESRRVATITPQTAVDYEDIMIYGRCKTYVLSKGVFQWNVTSGLPESRHKIGRKGVIMSGNYPYPNDRDAWQQNYLIQSPSADSKENIIVKYEVPMMASDVNFNIDQEIKAYDDQNKTLTAADSTYTSVSTYQQYILYTVPKNSTGFLIRYTVTSSANFTSLFTLFISLVVSWLV